MRQRFVRQPAAPIRAIIPIAPIQLIAAAVLAISLGAPRSLLADAPESMPTLDSAAAGVSGPTKYRPADPELAEFIDAVDRYEAAVRDYRVVVGEIVKGKYKEKRAEVEAAYEGKISKLEDDESARRLDAIARFEEFLRRYPSDPKYSPDAIFRLAELYFEKSQTEYLVAYEEFLKRDEAFYSESMPGETEPAEPEKDYSRTIELYQWLIRDFPEYRHIDGAYYLMGYCLSEQGDLEESKNTFLKLVYKVPKSKFSAEAWTRVGEYYFDHDELDPAVDAYKNAIDYGEGRYFDKALYKLAWTYYRMDDFDLAIKSFLSLVDYADDHEHEEGKPGSVLRPESIEYLAISLAEEDWDLDGEKDGLADPTKSPLGRAAYYLDPTKKRSYEVYRVLGKILALQTKYPEAVAVWRKTLELFPFEADNPDVQNDIILALKDEREFDEMIAEQERLARMYGDESAWAKGPDGIGGTADDAKRAALDKAKKLAETNFIEAATFHHRAGQVYREKWLSLKTKELFDKFQYEYGVAAELYEAYLDKYGSSSKLVYDVEFYLAESLYYSGKFLEAAKRYENVRDSNLDDKFLEDAAFSAIDAYTNTLGLEFTAGRLDEKATLDGMEKIAGETGTRPALTAGATVTPVPIPPLLLSLNGARDKFMEMVASPKAKEVHPDAIAYHAALVYYVYEDYDEARKRFEVISTKWPDSEPATFARKLIIETCRILNDLDCIVSKAGEYAKLDASAADEFKDAAFAASFAKALAAFEGGRWDEAAERFLTLAEERPDWSLRDKALNNAAVAYEEAKRYESALNVYKKLYKEHPTSEFAMPALYRHAINADRFFEYESAVSLYLTLVEKYGTKKKGDEKVVDSLRAAALLSESLGDYPKAAKLFLRYYDSYRSEEDAPDVLFRTAKVYEKDERWADAVKTYRRYVGDHSGKKDRFESVVESHRRISDAYLKMGKKKEALASCKDAVRFFDIKGLAPGGAAAEHAAKCQFWLVDEEMLADYAKLDLKATDAKKLGKKLETKAKKLKELEPKFLDVTRFDRPHWSLAAAYRVGWLNEEFKNKMMEIPNPYEKKCDKSGGVWCEAMDKYTTVLEDMLIPVEDASVAKYELVIKKGRELGVKDEWTTKALEAVHPYKPDEYPMLKDEKVLYEDTDFTSPPMEAKP